jgi:hypothetical protein
MMYNLALSSPLETLPLLALELINEFLATCDSRRRSLFARSLASKRCCEVVVRQRFESIHFAVENAQQLREVLSRWKEILNTGLRTRLVRLIATTGRMELKGEDVAEAFRAQ